MDAHDHKQRNLTRRTEQETERELRVNHQHGAPPGGAEGGDESPAADRPGALPAHDHAALGDTDQHSSSRGAPARRKRLKKSVEP